MKKGKVVFAICTLVIAVIIGMFACFSNVVNASEETSKNNETKVVNTENNSSKKERKGKKEALTDEEKEAKKAERKAKFENLTDEEKSVKIEINGGNITVKMGQGDTDGVDSNGDIIINGGTISVTGQSTFDYDGTGTINGGTVICNGEQVTTLPNQFMGGGMRGGNPGEMNLNGEMPGNMKRGR